MLKSRHFIVVALTISFVFTSFALADAPIVMKIGHSQPAEHLRHKSLLRFKEILEAKTKGAIKVEVYHSSQLGSEAEQLEAVKMGIIQATRGGAFEAVSEKFVLYTMPFLFKDLDSAHKITRGPIGAKIAKAAEKNGIYVPATGDAGGLRNITNNARPITKPEDMKGLKLRTPPIESIIRTMETLGASPVSIAYGEVYMALKTGVADGQENPYVNITAMKFYEVQKYLTVVNYQYHPDPFCVNLKWYKSLSPQLQRALDEASVEMMKYNDQLVEEETEASFEILKKHMKVNTLSSRARNEFIKRSQKVYDYFINRRKMFTKAELAEIQKLVQ